MRPRNGPQWGKSLLLEIFSFAFLYMGAMGDANKKLATGFKA